MKEYESTIENLATLPRSILQSMIDLLANDSLPGVIRRTILMRTFQRALDSEEEMD